jgi:Tfp pilus assembly protein PilO
VSISDRDRKIIMLLIPLAIAAAYWFLLLSPKREEAGKVKEQLATAQSQRDDATARAGQLSAAKRSFGTDYATVIRLGKSIPSGVDMPSLLVQLDRAARGTGIQFRDVKTGERTAAAGAAPAASSGGAPAAGAGNPAAQGAPAAQSGSGKAAQAAAGATEQSNDASAKSGLPANAPAGGANAGASVPGLETVPLDFEFSGSFFDLADFFHRMKRFVRVANDDILVRGRLISINSFTFDSSESFPALVATVHATVYLAPKAEGVAAGASPKGPAAPASGAPQTASKSAAPPTPVATVTTR